MSIKDEMPLLARHAGRWKGTYTLVDTDGNVLDRHASLLTCSFPEEGEHEYFQTNHYTWDDGREELLRFPATYRDGHIYFDTERINGHAWEVDEHCIVLTWRYVQAEGNQTLYELIHLDDSGTHRTRTWHWLRDGVCFQRTLIEEQKVDDVA